MLLKPENVEDDLVVAIFMVTYNHVNYIRQAVESVMIQRTGFKYKLFIGDDCSNDGTTEVCNELKVKYADKIELFVNPVNLGSLNNAKRTYQACFNSGARYIALLEGDDFWVDPNKLQKQIKILDDNQDYVLTSGNSIFLFDEDPLRVEYYRPYWSKCALSVLNTEDQIKFAPAFHTSTVVFRNLVNSEMLNFFCNTISGDITLFTLLSLKGKLHYEDEVLSCYRVHSGGITKSYTDFNGLKHKYEGKISMYKSLDSYFKYKYTKLYQELIDSNSRQLIKTYINTGHFYRLVRFVIFNLNTRHILLSFIHVIKERMKSRLRHSLN